MLSLHAALSSALRARFNFRLIEPHSGDLPFTVLFERPATWTIRRLAESGWHMAANVPWLAAAHAAGSGR